MSFEPQAVSSVQEDKHRQAWKEYLDTTRGLSSFEYFYYEPIAWRKLLSKLKRKKVRSDGKEESRNAKRITRRNP